jgi:TOBE domain
VSTPSLRQDGGRVVELAIRPERLRVGEGPTESELPNRVAGTVEDVTYEGALIAYGIALEDGQRLFVREQNRGAAPGRPPRRLGDRVVISWRPEDAMLLR